MFCDCWCYTAIALCYNSIMSCVDVTRMHDFSVSQLNQIPTEFSEGLLGIWVCWLAGSWGLRNLISISFNHWCSKSGLCFICHSSSSLLYTEENEAKWSHNVIYLIHLPYFLCCLFCFCQYSTKIPDLWATWYFCLELEHALSHNRENSCLLQIFSFNSK